MPQKSPTSFDIGNTVTLKKSHVCGGFEWIIYRMGADIGIRCKNCDRRVMTNRRQLQQKIKNRS